MADAQKRAADEISKQQAIADDQAQQQSSPPPEEGQASGVADEDPLSAHPS
jgi:hypothetical protein